jgi:hypothetical protein
MAREVVRKICGHVEAVYAVGSPERIGRKIGRSLAEPCRVCRSRAPAVAVPEEIPEKRDHKTENVIVRNILEQTEADP